MILDLFAGPGGLLTKREAGSIKQRLCRECGRINVRARRARGEK